MSQVIWDYSCRLTDSVSFWFSAALSYMVCYCRKDLETQELPVSFADKMLAPLALVETSSFDEEQTNDTAAADNSTMPNYIATETIANVTAAVENISVSVMPDTNGEGRLDQRTFQMLCFSFFLLVVVVEVYIPSFQFFYVLDV